GPAWVTTPQGGGKGQSPMVGDFRALQACCQTGRRTGAGTRAIRSHLPRSASLNQRQPAAPPSTRLTHMMQRKMVIRIPGLVSGAAFQRLAMVTAALPVTRLGVFPQEAADLVSRIYKSQITAVHPWTRKREKFPRRSLTGFRQVMLMDPLWGRACRLVNEKLLQIRWKASIVDCEPGDRGRMVIRHWSFVIGHSSFVKANDE